MLNTLKLTAMKYTELKNRHQEEVNNLPLFFAYSDSQFDEVLQKTGCTRENYRERLQNWGGAIIRKEDKPMIEATFDRHSAEMAKAMKDIEFFKDAVYYEMCNHEYSINYQGDYDVLNALGFYVEYSDGDELKNCKELTVEQKQAYKEMAKKYNRMAREKGWF